MCKCNYNQKYLNHFYSFTFWVSASQIALISSLLASGPIHPTSIHWIMRFRGNAGFWIQAAIEVKNSSRVLTCTLVNLVCHTGERNWQRCERLPQATQTAETEVDVVGGRGSCDVWSMRRVRYLIVRYVCGPLPRAASCRGPESFEVWTCGRVAQQGASRVRNPRPAWHRCVIRGVYVPWHLSSGIRPTGARRAQG